MERFAAKRDVAEGRVNVPETKNPVLSRSPVRYSLQIKEEAVEQVEKFKYVGVVFISDGKFEEEIDWRMRVASGVLRESARKVVTKAELRLKAKLSMFKSIFILMLTYGHESWIMTEILRFRAEAAEMGF
ncbi:unnamed protein product [Soboliphyme baturini]|uniref:Reverse transcriptase domain-containing protein n=1 Tax=Soboliphyme baturini TaxID=241478 RepID=A0A183ILJ1_9BILA|nr:unnamed protein product [Soboliphyme baturini]